VKERLPHRDRHIDAITPPDAKEIGDGHDDGEW
jgi:hypothetical protein